MQGTAARPLRRPIGRPLLLLGICAASVSGCGKKEQPSAPPPKPEASVMQPVRQDVPVYVALVGQTLGSQDIEIRARTEGWIEALHFREGTEVRKGDLLYSIDPRPMQERVAAADANVAEARAQLSRAQAGVPAAEAQVAAALALVAEAEAALGKHEGDVRRYEPLVAIKAVSRQDLDTAVAQRDAARERVAANKQAVEVARKSVEAARGEVAAAQGGVDAALANLESAKINLGYTKIYSPLAGLIGKTKYQVGDLVGQAGTAALNTVSAVNPIYVEFSLNEREYLNLSRRLEGAKSAGGKDGSLELILADGSVHPHRGSINFADRQVDPATGTLRLQASFPNPEKILRPGQFARIRGVVETKQGALLVPQNAVQELQGQYQVFVVGAGDKIEVRNAAMGQRVGELWVAEEGLKPDDRVIVEGLQRLRAGMEVVPKTASRTPEPAQPAAAPAAPAAPAGEGR